MSHLSPERLAALADDTPTPVEAAHITTCEACTVEIAAHRRVARMAAAASGSFGPPSSNFDTLLPRLRAEGLVDEADRRARVTRIALRIAASVAFLAGGVAVGRVTAGVEIPGIPGAGAGGVMPAAARSATFGSPDEAMQVMLTAQDAYQNAAAYLASQDTTQRFDRLNTEAFRTRLSALDEMAAASRSALYRAPQDPLLNQYYLAFQAAREQTLQQLAVSLPGKRQLGRY
jgi:hypothetical protein